MSTEKSVREIVENWNLKAKAKGMYLDRDPWSIAPGEGSLLDVQETPESLARIGRLQQQIADLQQQQERAGAIVTEVAGGVAQEVQSLLPEEPAIEEQPSVADRA